MWNLRERIQMNLFQNRNRFTHFVKLMVSKADRCWGGRWTGGLAYAHWGIWNYWPTWTCCIAKRTLPSILWSWSSMWEKNLKENGYVYMYDRITLLYSRNYHNLVNRLYFNKKKYTYSTLCIALIDWNFSVWTKLRGTDPQIQSLCTFYLGRGLKLWPQRWMWML